jgi:EpsI family protein
VKVVALAVGLAIAANWLRVTSLIVIGHVSEMEAAVIHSHHTYGWLIFLLFVLLVFFPLAGIIVRRADGAAVLAGAGATGGGREDEAVPAGGAPTSLAARATVVAAVGPLLFWAVGALPSREAPSPAVPDVAVGAFLRTESGASPYDWRPGYQNALRTSSTGWSDGTTHVALDHLVYRGQTQGAELIGYPNRIAPDSLLATERMIGPVGPERRIVNEAIVREGAGHLLVWYWYRVGGIETASPLKAKLLEIPAFFRRVDSSELIALSTACDLESCEAGARALAAILGEGT